MSAFVIFPSYHKQLVFIVLLISWFECWTHRDILSESPIRCAVLESLSIGRDLLLVMINSVKVLIVS